MSHRAAAAIPLVLIALCAAAFLRAEQLKLHHSAVGHPHVRQAFSPGCTDPGCLPVAKLRFTLRKPQALDLAIVDANGNVQKTLATGRALPEGSRGAPLGRQHRLGRAGRGRPLPAARHARGRP